MKVFPGIFILLAVSSASASSFDFSSALNSVLKTVLDTSQFENNISYEDNNDIIINRAPSAFELGKCEVDEDECEYHQALREQKRIDDARRKIQESEVYTCILDTPGYSQSKYDAAPSVEVAVDGTAENGSYDDYHTDDYRSDYYACNQRLATIDKNAKEKRRQEEAQRRAKLPKKVEPTVGMTTDQVRKSSWGNPVIIELSTDAQGTYETWGYYFNKVLYFKNGKVTKIEQIKGGQ